MEFSEIFSFLTILKESIKLLPKNGKLMSSIAILSIILPSILLLLFIHFYRILTDYVNATVTGPDSGSYLILNMLKYLALQFLVEIASLLVFFVISHVSEIATILVSSASYSGNNLSSKDLFMSIKSTWRKPLSSSFHSSRHSSKRYLSVILFLAVLLGFWYPIAFTISTAVIIGTPVIIFQLYSSVVWALARVVSVLEESSPGEALEKAGNLVRGHHLKGFMLNLFVNLLFLIVFSLAWMLSDKGFLNLTVYWLIFVNVFSIVKMLLFMAYTVLYFQCKKHNGEEIGVYGNVEYTELSATAVGNDIP